MFRSSIACSVSMVSEPLLLYPGLALRRARIVCRSLLRPSLMSVHLYTLVAFCPWRSVYYWHKSTRAVILIICSVRCWPPKILPERHYYISFFSAVLGTAFARDYVFLSIKDLFTLSGNFGTAKLDKTWSPHLRRLL
jgi:hypothetical protein